MRGRLGRYFCIGGPRDGESLKQRDAKGYVLYRRRGPGSTPSGVLIHESVFSGERPKVPGPGPEIFPRFPKRTERPRGKEAQDRLLAAYAEEHAPWEVPAERGSDKLPMVGVRFQDHQFWEGKEVGKTVKVEDIRW